MGKGKRIVASICLLILLAVTWVSIPFLYWQIREVIIFVAGTFLILSILDKQRLLLTIYASALIVAFIGYKILIPNINYIWIQLLETFFICLYAVGVFEDRLR